MCKGKVQDTIIIYNLTETETWSLRRKYAMATHWDRGGDEDFFRQTETVYANTLRGQRAWFI